MENLSFSSNDTFLSSEKPTTQLASFFPQTSSQEKESERVFLFDEIQSIPIEQSNLLLNRTLDLSNEMMNDDTKSHDSLYDDRHNLEVSPFNSVISANSSSKLNEYVLREKELLNQLHKAKPSFDKKRLYDLRYSMNYLSFFIESYFSKPITKAFKAKQSKKADFDAKSKEKGSS